MDFVFSSVQLYLTNYWGKKNANLFLWSCAAFLSSDIEIWKVLEKNQKPYYSVLCYQKKWWTLLTREFQETLWKPWNLLKSFLELPCLRLAAKNAKEELFWKKKFISSSLFEFANLLSSLTIWKFKFLWNKLRFKIIVNCVLN